MMESAGPPPEGSLLAVIGDEDTVTGFLLAGVGHMDLRRTSNFLIVNDKTPAGRIEAAFREFTARPDIAVVLVTQAVAEEIRPAIASHAAAVPAILEIPSKDTPYNPAKDGVLARVRHLLGGEGGGGGGHV